MASFYVQGCFAHAIAPGEIEIVPDGLIAIADDGRIEDVSAPGRPEHEAHAQRAAASGAITKLGPRQMLTPGFVDLHIHAPQWPQAGTALHLSLADWLRGKTFPLEVRYADIAFARRVYDSLVDTLIANGTTTALYFATIHAEASLALAEICLARGQRAFIGKVAMDHPDSCPVYYRDASAAEAIAATSDFIARVASLQGNESKLAQGVITPRFIPSCTDALLEGLGDLAQSTGAAVQTHCSESDWEAGHVRERFGLSDSHCLHRFGLMTRRTVLAHSNFIDDADMALIAERGAGVAHCPLSNFYFANSVFPLRKALEKGLHVGLGTDISGGPSPSMFDACRMAIAASRGLNDGVDPDVAPESRGRPGSSIDFRTAFWLATAGGGQALDAPIGQFKPGYQFDALLLDPDAPGSNVVSFDAEEPEILLQKLIYNAGRANIASVWIGGRQVRGERA
ncbi:guanine deaminase [Terrarubrum flagellatum]|uniref:guanine deaminase n=1 Tax=Terrirubrum flagellatum TaxID=2895980 RepID=UPI003145381F